VIYSLYRLVGFAICHQLPERSLAVGGRALPVCARDTGIYVGFLVCFVLLSLAEPDHPREMPPRWVLFTCIGFIAVMGIDGVTSYAGMRETTNDIRLATGLLAGFALPPIALGMLNYQLWKTPAPGRVLETRSDQVVWLAAIPATFLVMRFPVAGLWWFYATLVIAGVLIAFTSVNLIMVSLVPPLERRVTGLVSAMPLVAAAFLMTVGELSATAWLHGWAVRAMS
jgi:uncharacterized membrane protein